MKSICVYCSSSDIIDPAYFRAAEELGAAIASIGASVVYGGTYIGLMGAVARAAHACTPRGNVIGIIPDVIHSRGLAYEEADELILTRDLRERKHIMQERSDAFIALPGGLGTLEEVLEIITLKQLNMHQKPIVLLDIRSYYQPLLAAIEHAIDQRFVNQSSRKLYYVAEDVASAMDHLAHYRPPQIDAKWLTTAG